MTEESVPVMERVNVTNLTDEAFQNVNVTLVTKVTNVNVPQTLLHVTMTMELNVVAKENVNVENVSVIIQMNGRDYFVQFQIVQIVFVQLVKLFQDGFQNDAGIPRSDRLTNSNSRVHQADGICNWRKPVKEA